MEFNQKIKIMLVENSMSLKELAAEFSKLRGKICSPSSLSQRINKGKMAIDDVELLLKVLGYKIKFEKE